MKNAHEGEITMLRKSNLLLLLLVFAVPLSMQANTITMYTSQAAWNAATNGTTATNFQTFFAANNIASGYITGPQTYGGITYGATQATNCAGGAYRNQMYVTATAGPNNPAGLYQFMNFSSNSCYDPGSGYIILPGQGATAFAFTVQSYPGNIPGFATAFAGGVSFYTGTGTNLGSFGNLGISQPTFLGFTSTTPIHLMYTSLTACCLQGVPEFFYITNASFGSAGAPTTVIPEPSSLLLSGSGLFCIVGTIRRKLRR